MTCGRCPVCKQFTRNLEEHKRYHADKKAKLQKDGEFKPMFQNE